MCLCQTLSVRSTGGWMTVPDSFNDRCFMISQNMHMAVTLCSEEFMMTPGTLSHCLISPVRLSDFVRLLEYLVVIFLSFDSSRVHVSIFYKFDSGSLIQALPLLKKKKTCNIHQIHLGNLREFCRTVWRTVRFPKCLKEYSLTVESWINGPTIMYIPT